MSEVQYDDGLDLEDQIEGDEPETPEVVPPTVEERARAMGWHPYEEYRGPPRRWVDAKTFIERGETELPILRQQSRNLTERNVLQDREITALRGEAARLAKLVEQSLDLQRKAEERGYTRGLAELKAARREAIQTGDVARAEAIDDQIDQMQTNRPAPAPEPERRTEAPTVDPAAIRFIQENPWFNTDPQLNAAMLASEGLVRSLYPSWPLEDQLDEAKERLIREFPHKFPNESSTVAAPQPPPRRVAPVSRPSAPLSQPRREATGWDRVPIEERATAKAAFEREAEKQPGLTREMWLSLYFNPKQNVLTLRRAAAAKK